MVTMWYRWAGLLMALGATCWSAGGSSAEVATDVKQTFPRIAGINIGAKNYDEAQYQEALAKKDLIILGFYRGWWNRGGVTIREAVQQLKARNPKLLVGQYTSLNEHYQDGGSEPVREAHVKLSTEKGPGGSGDWWARTAAGEHVSSYPGTWNTNFTEFVTPDACGDRYPEWLAKHNNAVFFDPVPEFDLWFTDNVFYRPRVEADWDGDGKDDSADDPQVRAYYRRGTARYWQAIRKLQPTKLILGNVDGRPSAQSGGLREPEYTGRIEGALVEAGFGEQWSYETWGSWQDAMDDYRSQLANTIAPHLVIFNVHGEKEDYALMRYGLTSTLMDDGYFDYSDMGSYSTAWWYDEFDVDLGKAVSPPPTKPWQHGVYRQNFEKGAALVNPKGNGTQTVTLEPGLRRFIGKQCPKVNDGRPVSRLTLNERDGIVLVREKH